MVNDEQNQALATGPKGPVIGHWEVHPTELVRPRGQDVFLVELKFSYTNEGGYSIQLIVTSVSPDGAHETLVHYVEAAVAPQGRESSESYYIAHSAKSKLGRYEYRLQLVDSRGQKSPEVSVAVTVVDMGAPRLGVTDITPAQAQAGELIVLHGNGFDTASLDSNVVSVGGVVAEVKDVTAKEISCVVPAAAGTGKVSVANRLGVAFSTQQLKIIPRITIWPESRQILTPLTSSTFRAVVTGLANRSVEWRVNGIPGGSSEVGTIDQNGTYLAPAVPPAEKRQVEIVAMASADQTLTATTHVYLSPPFPLVGPSRIVRSTGGRVQDEDGLLMLYIPSTSLHGDLTITRIRTELVRGKDSLPGLPDNAFPIMRFEIYHTNEDVLVGPVQFHLCLPMWTQPGTEYRILFQRGNKFEDSGAHGRVAKDGVSLIGELDRLNRSAVVVSPKMQIHPLGEDVEIEAVNTPFGQFIEEGTTLPILIQGKGFQRSFTRVSAADPAQSTFFVFGPVLVNKKGTQLGFTLKIVPIEHFGPGDPPMKVSFRVERLDGSGVVVSQADTSPEQFQIKGLNELDVQVNPDSRIFTIDGTRLDKVINDPGRYSRLRIAETAVLGIGSPVSSAFIDDSGVPKQLSSLATFEAAFGSQRWIDDLRASHPEVAATAQILQPTRTMVHFEVTGPVQLYGRIYIGGMHGGENFALQDPPGQGRPGGLASAGLSGGKGGDGGVTHDSNTSDGYPAGNGTDLGRGRNAQGGVVVTQALAGEGTRFDPQVISLDEYFLKPVDDYKEVKGIIETLTDPPSGFIDILDDAVEKARKELPRIAHFIHDAFGTARIDPNRVVTGQGGAGGTRPGGVNADLVEDEHHRIYPGTGGGGGGGGGSSAHTETLFGFTVGTDNHVGGGGGGGGGAAGAIRITTSDRLYIDALGGIDGQGGRGGLGELHLSLASPGGGGGGGAGAIVKLQSPQLINRGLFDISGGAQAGALALHSGSPTPTTYAGRVQVLEGPRAGAMLYYGFREPRVNPPEIYLLWPTGRQRVKIQMPSLHSIRAVGTCLDPATVLLGLALHRQQTYGFGAYTSLLIVTGDDQLFVGSAPDPYDGNPAIFPDGAIDLSGYSLINLRIIPELAGFTLTDAAQSPTFPYHIFVSGVMGAVDQAIAESQVHEFEYDGHYVGMPFHTMTANLAGGAPLIGHLKDIDFLSDGTMVGLMANASPFGQGIHRINLGTNTATLIFPDDVTLASMSVSHGNLGPHSIQQGQGQDILYVVRWSNVVDTDAPPVLPRIEHYVVFGQQISLPVFVLSTISSPGEPGLLRLDGAVPGARTPRVAFEGQDPPDPKAGLDPSVSSYPAVGSFSAPVADFGSSFESLVLGQDQVMLFGQGAAPNDPNIRLLTQVDGQINSVQNLVADEQGQLSPTIKLAPAPKFNTTWFEHLAAGPTPDLLRRQVLYIPQD